MPTPKRKPSRPPAVKRLAKPSRGPSARPRASATAPPPATVAAPPPAPAVPLTVATLRELLQTDEGRALRAELLQIAPSSTQTPAAELDDGAPFGHAYPPPKSEQVQLRVTEREHALYQAAARRGDLWPEGRALPTYEALRRLAWEGARARGLTQLDPTTTPARILAAEQRAPRGLTAPASTAAPAGRP